MDDLTKMKRLPVAAKLLEIKLADLRKLVRYGKVPAVNTNKRGGKYRTFLVDVDVVRELLKQGLK